jgi:hypothetical protein
VIAPAACRCGGPTSVTAPGKPCVFRVRFHKEGKKVLIARFDAV